MCKKTNYKTSNSRIDKCMVPLIKYFNRIGVKTISCCCGHGHKDYPMTVVAVQDDGAVYEILSGDMLYNKDKSNYMTRNFYKRDEEGYYYIPEVVNK